MMCIRSRSFPSRCLRFVLATIATLGVAGRSVLAAPPVVAVVGDRLVIQGVRRGASVALLGAAHEPGSYMTRIVSYRQVLTDDDGDGIIEYGPAHGVAFQSIWITTDLATGEATLTLPSGYRAMEMPQPGARGNAVNLQPNALDIDRDHADILVVRPNRGAWSIPVREGQSAATPVKARTAVLFQTLHPLGQTMETRHKDSIQATS